jgi:hypothetical protein
MTFLSVFYQIKKTRPMALAPSAFLWEVRQLAEVGPWVQVGGPRTCALACWASVGSSRKANQIHAKSNFFMCLWVDTTCIQAFNFLFGVMNPMHSNISVYQLKSQKKEMGGRFWAHFSNQNRCPRQARFLPICILETFQIRRLFPS